MNLAALIPVSSIEAQLRKPIRSHARNPASSAELAKDDAGNLMGIALFGWHRVVQSGNYDVEPTSIGRFMDNGDDAGLADFVEQTIGRPLFVEAGLMDAFVTYRGKEFKTASSCAVVLFTGEFHLCDLDMADPRHRLPKAQCKSPSQHHRGFGLLTEVMDNVGVAASERGCDPTSLMAAWRPLVPIFARHGFGVEDSIVGRSGMTLGSGIPMLRWVR